MAAFTSEEYADMLLAYGSANTNSREARRIYQERYPNRRVPSHQTFATTYRRLRQTGNLNFQEPRVNAARPDTTIDEQVLAEFDADPTKSIRKIASLLGLSIWKVWSVLRADGRHAFHYTPVQGLDDSDFGRRVQFCRHLLHTDVDDVNFLKSILWTDESKFDKEGIVNYHNLHHWAVINQNPHVKRQRGFQRRFSVNVWAGVIGDKLIGPHYLPDNINANNYLDFLINDLPPLVEEVFQVDINRPIVFQHDGCPAHWSLIGRGGPIPWPRVDVWGRAKELVYTTEVESREDLINRIDAAFEVMQQEMLLRTTTVEIRRRCRACIVNEGRQFEHL